MWLTNEQQASTNFHRLVILIDDAMHTILNNATVSYGCSSRTWTEAERRLTDTILVALELIQRVAQTLQRSIETQQDACSINGVRRAAVAPV